MKSFLTSEHGKRFAPVFRGTNPGEPEFDKRYRQLAEAQGTELADAEHSFLYETHYLPAANKAESLGFDLTNRAIQEAIWSMAIQHGAYQSGLMIEAVEAAGGAHRDPQTFIQGLYDQRIKRAPSQRYRYSAEVEKVKEFDRELRAARTTSPFDRRRWP